MRKTPSFKDDKRDPRNPPDPGERKTEAQAAKLAHETEDEEGSSRGA